MKPLEKIEKLVKKFSVDTNAERNELVLNELLEAQAKSKKTKSALAEPNIWRIIMKNRITKLTTAAVIIIAVFIGINHFGGSIDGATPAFAEVLEQIYKARNVIFNQTFYTNKTDPFTVKRMLIEPGIMRTEHTRNGKTIGVTIYDYESGKHLQFNPSQKTAYLRQRIGRAYAEKMFNYLDWISKIHIKEGQFVGQEEFNGQLTNVFVVEYDYETITVWVDPVTNLPVHVETVQTSNPNENIITPHMALSEADFGGDSNITRSVTIGSGRGSPRGIQEDKKLVMSDFEWNAELNQSLFSLIPPEGYTVEKMQFDASDPSERVLIEALAFWAEMSGGSFPLEINYLGDPNKIKPMLIEKYDSDGDPKQEFNLAFEKMNRILQGLMFAQQLKADENWNYAGDGVQLGDAERPVSWYRLGDSQNYRVIYGDLSTRDVSIEDLPE